MKGVLKMKNKEEQVKNTEGVNNIQNYEDEISKLEGSKMDSSSNYQKAKTFMLKVTKDEKVTMEQKVELLDKAYKKLLLTKEQTKSLNDLYILELSHTKQFKDEYIKNIMEETNEDDTSTYQLIPYMDYTKNYGFSYMAVRRGKNGKLEKFFVSSKKEVYAYNDCQQIGIHLKHQNNSSNFHLKSYFEFYNKKDNVTAGNMFKILKKQLQRFIIFPNSELYDIVTLWIMHTYTYCIFRYVPYVWLTSMSAGSGKSTVLDVVTEYAFNAKTNVGTTPAVVFRLINKDGSVLVLDEFENMTGEDKSLMLQILNAGFQAGGTVSRCDNNFEPIEYNAFSPKIFAGLTDIDDVLLTRCIKIEMKMVKDKSSIEEFNNNDIDFKEESTKIRNDLHIFGLKYADKIYNLYNSKDLLTLEKDYTPREKDLWKPLIAIAKIVDEEENISTEQSILSYSKILHEELEKVKYTDIKPKLIKFLEEYIKDPSTLSSDIYPNWYSVTELFYDLKDNGEFSELNSTESLGRYLSGFGFEKALKNIVYTNKTKKKTGYYITSEKIEELKKKYGLDMI